MLQITSTDFDNLAGRVLAEVVAGAPGGAALLVVDHDLRVAHALGELDAFAIEPADTPGRPLAQLLSPEAYGELMPLYRRALGGDRVGPVPAIALEPSGQLVAEFVPLQGDHGTIVAAMSLLIGHAPLPGGEAALRYLANHDSLTGLLNEHSFHEALGRQVAYASRYGCHGAVLLLDLDGFGALNDALGVHAADAILFGVAEALRERLRRTDIIARVGADEFAVLVPAGGLTEGEAVAEGILHAVRRARAPHTLTGSVGMALLANVPELSGEYLLHAADFALYRARCRGGDGWVLYEPPRIEPADL